MDYKKTLNITLNDNDPGAMPQRANLPAREPELLSYWDQIDLYGLSLKKDAPKGTFILHDGPPYSNGDIHLGHALNKIAKDIIVKYKTMDGFRSPYVPGWDNHGMPIENEVSKEFRKKGEKPDKVTMRKRCREYASSFVDRQREQFKRLGVRGDWSNPYLTMDPAFEATIVEVFGELAEQGFIYRGLKPVLWCGTCETALADAEVEYAEHTSNSIYVRFPVHRDPNQLFGSSAEDPVASYIVIWTTTPWTIPANLALAVHPDASYVVVEAGGARYLVAEPLAGRVLEVIDPGAATKWAEEGSDLGRLPVLARVKGEELEGVIAWHPLYRRTSPVVTAPYVTMEDGTGIVHTAPGHGKEDFDTGQKYGLEVLNPVGPDGRFTKLADAQPSYGFEGARIIGGEADNRVLEALRAAGALLLHQPFQHQYPHCWRCHSPLIFRATVQWFMNIDHDDHRQKALQAIEQTRWYPPVSINRISSMVAGRPDWCLSRQRAWGVGIPAFYCRDCGKEILSREAIRFVAEKVAADSSDAWYALPADQILPSGFACPHCGGTTFDKETDILDVWFDSGSTNRGVLENQVKWPNLRSPADVYLEGSDQHRGWFNSSLMVSVATKGRAPYDAVITNGWTLDENGRAMHKSWGNAVSPLDVIQKSGADILRLWVASVDYFEDVRCSEGVIDTVAETYRRIRNTFRFLVNNLYIGTPGRRFDPEKDGVPDADLLDLDRWALAQMDRVVGLCRAGYDAFEFHRIFHAVNNFCAVELSAFYLDVIKDRLYCSAADSVERRSALTALYSIAETLARLLAPILSHTSEEVWGVLNRPGGVPSPQLAPFPRAAGSRFAGVLERWEPVMAARERVSAAVEAARQEKTIGNPLEARVDVAADADTFNSLHPLSDLLPVVFKVSQVSLRNGASSVDVAVTPAPGTKCARCWLVKEDVGSDASRPDLCARCASVVNTLALTPEG
jgi:isoleucyl-tRNA synthetase